MIETRYQYGMKNRGYSIGCQPKNGIVRVFEEENGEKIEAPGRGSYYSVIEYDRELTAEEISTYELELIGSFSYK